MIKRKIYKNGDVLGENIIFLNRVDQRKALFKCFCGKEFESYIGNIKAQHTKSCGCLKINKNFIKINPKQNKNKKNFLDVKKTFDELDKIKNRYIK